MINRSARFFLVACALASGALLPTVAYADLKVAVVDARRAILETAEGKNVLKRLDTKQKPEIERLKALQAEIKGLQDRLSKDKDVLSDGEKDKIAAEGEVKSREFGRHQQALQEIQGQASQELGEKFQARLVAALRAIGESEKYDLILDSGSAPYASPSRDITKRVTEMLDRPAK